jgi:hypothetical protein
MAPRLFVIATDECEWHVTAMDADDAVRTAEIDPNDINSIAEYDNRGEEVMH